MLKLTLLVGLGGMVGSVARFVLGNFITKLFPSSFPYATLAVNLLGCFIIGVLMGLYIYKSSFGDDWKLFLTTGICGGFTTFSAFSFEALTLMKDGKVSAAIAYVSISVIIGLLCTWGGYSLSNKF
ncbi:MAG: fluoride efflux transporter CrcB [Bacteroidetes bacterium]|nr:fluoride efflux transporter CrcB [Bacteroidota bacterium]